MADDYNIQCPTCNTTFDKRDLQVLCSNCFGCTGCERYLCPVCDNAIVVIPVKKMGWNE